MITTNYDDLLERAFSEVGGARVPRVACRDSHLASPRDSDVLLLHVHGHFKDADSIVVTLEDYRRLPLRNPGILAKLKQLLLEHPLLVVGFSATDPNFVQWSGWLEDVLGRHRPPAVWLGLADVPGPRHAYWSGALQPVNIGGKEALAPVLRALAQALAPTSAKLRLEQSVERLPSAGTIGELWERTQKALEHLERFSLTPFRWHERIQQVVIDRAIELWAGRAGENVERIKSMVKRHVPHQTAQHSDPAKAPGDPDPADVLRRCFVEDGTTPDYWVEFSLLFARVRDTLWAWRRPQYSLRQLLDDVRNDATAARIRGLIATIEARRAGSAADDTDGLPEPAQQERQRTIARSKLHSGEQVHEDDLPVHDRADRLRARGYLAWQQGDAEEACRAYFDAAEFSKGNEPPWLEWMTIESHRLAQDVLSFRSYGKPQRLRLRLDERAELLMRLEPTVKDLETIRRRAVSEGLKFLTKDRNSAPLSVRSSEPPVIEARNAESLLDRLERHYMAPTAVGAMAEIAGVARWLRGSRKDACLLLSRYGSKQLGELVGTAATRGESAKLADEVADYLLQHGRWASEWASRLEALQTASLEFTDDRHLVLEGWLEAAAAALLRDGTVPVRGSSWTSGSFANEFIDVLVTRLIALEKPHDAIPLLEKWRKRMEVSGDEDELARAVAKLPWSEWLRGGLPTQVADCELVRAFDQLDGAPDCPRFLEENEELLGGDRGLPKLTERARTWALQSAPPTWFSVELRDKLGAWTPGQKGKAASEALARAQKSEDRWDVHAAAALADELGPEEQRDLAALGKRLVAKSRENKGGLLEQRFREANLCGAAHALAVTGVPSDPDLEVVMRASARATYYAVLANKQVSTEICSHLRSRVRERPEQANENHYWLLRGIRTAVDRGLRPDAELVTVVANLAGGKDDALAVVASWALADMFGRRRVPDEAWLPAVVGLTLALDGGAVAAGAAAYALTLAHGHARGPRRREAARALDKLKGEKRARVLRCRQWARAHITSTSESAETD
ncbi:MAG: SIR2 family protein [Myxococcales bacterium]|nr:SIR2 family protein [Myxococcales bacterium]